MAVSRQDVIDAWASIASWVEGPHDAPPPGSLSSTSIGQKIDDQTYHVDGVDLCSPMSGTSRFGSWGTDGQAAVALTGLTITTMSAVKQQAATMSTTDDTVVLLPCVATFMVSGASNVTQSCARYLLGMKTSGRATGAESDDVELDFTQTTLTFTAKVGDTLTLTEVDVSAGPAVKVTTPAGRDPAWLRSIENTLFGYISNEIRAATQTAFALPALTKPLTAALDTQLGT